MSDRFRPRPADAPRPPNLVAPVLIGLVALLSWQAFQAVELVLEHQALEATYDAQARDVAGGTQVRAQLDALLSGATKLAEGHNGAAAGALAELAKQGVTYTPPP